MLLPSAEYCNIGTAGIFRLPEVNVLVATHSRQLFELLPSADTDLDGLQVTLVIGGRDIDLRETYAAALSTIVSQLLAINTGGVNRPSTL
jgi:hypothetical protein